MLTKDLTAQDLSTFNFDKLWKRVIKTDKCWNWTGPVTTYGHGTIRYIDPNGNKKTLYAHRASYVALVGTIPGHLEIDHLCRNPRCVNPTHLEAVTHAENLRRGVGKKLTPRQTHCKRGHSLADARITPTGHRVCRGCRPIHNKKQDDKRRGDPRYFAIHKKATEKYYAKRKAEAAALGLGIKDYLLQFRNKRA